MPTVDARVDAIWTVQAHRPRCAGSPSNAVDRSRRYDAPHARSPIDAPPPARCARWSCQRVDRSRATRPRRTRRRPSASDPPGPTPTTPVPPRSRRRSRPRSSPSPGRRNAPEVAAPAVNPTAIVPGAVHRSSLAISATYDVNVRLSVATRRVGGKAVIEARNRSGAGIDRLLLNTVMAKLGALDLGTVTVDGRSANARVDGQTIVVPLGGVLPDGADDHHRRPVQGPARLVAVGLEVAVHARERHRRHAPLDPVGQPQAPVRAAQPRRPVRDARSARGSRSASARTSRWPSATPGRSSTPPTAAARRPSARPTCATSWSPRRPTTA